MKAFFFFKATTRFELVIRVLQTHALPLGYVALFNYILQSNSDSKEVAVLPSCSIVA